MIESVGDELVFPFVAPAAVSLANDCDFLLVQFCIHPGPE
jgi:hypothetical protein